MSDQDVVIRIVGDVNDVVTKLDDVKQKMQNIGTAGASGNDLLKKNYRDISVELSELNEKLRNEIALKKQSASDTAKRIQDLTKEKNAIDAQAQAMTRHQSAGQKLNSMMGKLGITIGVAFAARAIINFAKESVKAYREAQEGEAKLLAALNGRKDVQERLLAQGMQIQSTTTTTHEEVNNAQAFLAVQGRTEDQIKQTIAAALDLSVVTGDNLEGAVRKLDMTYEGSLGRMGRLEKSLKDLSKEQLANGDAIKILGEKYKGMALAMAQTDAGKVKMLENAFGELKETIGSGLSGALADASVRLRGWVQSLDEAIKPDAAKEIDQQKQKFILLGDAASREGLTKERRIELIKQMQAVQPEFLKGLDLEKITVDQISDSYKKSLASFNNQIEAKKFSINIEKTYNDLASEQVTIDAEREEAAQKLSKGASASSGWVKEAALGLAEYGQEFSNFGGVWNRFIPGMQRIQAQNLINIANYREGGLAIKQYRLSIVESLKSMVSEGWDPHNAKVQEAERIMRQLGATDGTIAKLVEQFRAMQNAVGNGAGGDDVTGAYKKLTDELAALKTKQQDLLATGSDLSKAEKQRMLDLIKQIAAIDGVSKSMGVQTTSYQRLTESISKLHDKLIEQIMSGKGDIEVTKRQIIEKELQKKRIDDLNKSFQELIDLQGNINTLDVIPFEPDGDAQTYWNEFSHELARQAAGGKPITLDFDLKAKLPKTLESGSGTFAQLWSDNMGAAGEKAALSFEDGLINGLLKLEGDTGKINAVKGAITSIFNDVIGMVEQGLSDQIEANISVIEENISRIDKLIEEKQNQVDAEKQLAEDGKANVLAIKQSELNELNTLRAKAEADRQAEIEKQKKQEKELATIKSAIGMITLLAQAAEYGPIAGPIIGAAAVISFLASMAAVWSDASNATSGMFGRGTAEILGGRSHSNGGTSLGAYGTAERGEFLGILKKDKTQKYGQAMLSLFDGLNNANENKKLLGLSGLMDLREINTTSTQKFELKEIPEIKGIYKEMKKQGKTVYYENGKRIEKQGANTRIVYVN